MSRISKAKLWLAVAIISTVIGVISLPLAILFAYKLSYIPMAIFTVLVFHACYGAPFYFRAYKRERAKADT